MKPVSFLLLAIVSCIMIGNSSFSCISSRKLSVDSISYLKTKDYYAYGLRPRIDITDLKTDSLRIELPGGNYLFTRQQLKNQPAFVAIKDAKRIYTIGYFEIINAKKDSVNTTLLYHSYNKEHISLSERDYTQKAIMLPVTMIDSFTFVHPPGRPQL